MDDARERLRSIVRMVDHDRFIEACQCVDEIGVYVGCDEYDLRKLRKQLWDECEMVLWNRLESDGVVWFVKLDVLKVIKDKMDLLTMRDPEDRRLVACIEMVLMDPLGFEFSEVDRKEWSSKL